MTSVAIEKSYEFLKAPPEPIEAYLSMGTHKLRTNDVPALAEIRDQLITDQHIPFYTSYMLGWIAYELAEVAENNSDSAHTADGLFEESIDQWSEAYQENARPYDMDKLGLHHAMLMARTRQMLLRGRTPVEMEMALMSLTSSLTATTITLYEQLLTAHRQHNPQESIFKGKATEWLFGSLLLRYSQDNKERLLLPYPASPRQEHPNKSVHVDRKKTTRDFNVKCYEEDWKLLSSHAVQLKSTYNADRARRYDHTRVIMIYGDTDMGVKTYKDGLRLALALDSRNATPKTLAKLKRVQAHVGRKVLQEE